MGFAAPAHQANVRTITCSVLAFIFLTVTHSSALAAPEGEPPVPEEPPPLPVLPIPDEAIDNFLFRVNDRMRETVRTLGSTATAALPVPILFGVEPEDIEDTWRDPRPGGRVHEGVDIAAPSGAIVVSPTEAVVTNVGFDRSGGNYVITANPGGEQFYYAHLEGIADTLMPGARLEKGDIIGTIGTTGNAQSTGPHLHFGMYYRGSAVYPNPRLTHTFSLQQKAEILERAIETSALSFATIAELTEHYADMLAASSSTEVILPQKVALLLAHPDLRTAIHSLERNLTLGDTGEPVRVLQEFLMHHTHGPAAARLAAVGATGYFGSLTRAALAEYQETSGITPASGYFGPKTRVVLLQDLLTAEHVPKPEK